VVATAFMFTPGASAATNCQAFVNVGHGISIAPCIQVVAGNQVNEGGTVIKFISNPLIRNCVLETIIVDSTTGVRSYYDGPLSEGQCTVNAKNHATWTPNPLLTHSKACEYGHRYYTLIDIKGNDVSGGKAFQTFGAQAGPVTC